ncbi:diguanylate cyclase [Larsenimonas suaedae]|uniref:Diguanylate cyclase n=1 Tax=Larsenimonas suaedae TaxID=1851019 RepID=A0ABU1GRD2_9GAMM|nr:diguanylate cyclase [Larsenimonas suaedae]MCM2972615.1 diguanylate cyclase [Larsenimonas suaedae]MDR5894589.1 diguanylate cyclase [Larsenimonas suaedae]
MTPFRTLLRVLRTRITARATITVVGVVGVLGVLFLGAALGIQSRDEAKRQGQRLEELMSTVERATQIACFINDTQLAQEVVEGLLGNRIVMDVRIIASDTTVLAAGGAGGQGADTAVSRDIKSPFDASKSICRIFMVPDQAQIDHLVADASRFLSAALVLQLLGIGLCVILVTVKFVTRPIAGLSRKLGELEAETGQKLDVPRGNHHDEIGRLVLSVNAMIDRLMQSLTEERRLRQLHAMEERRYSLLFDNVEAGIFEIDHQGRLVSANAAFQRLFELESIDRGQQVPVLSERVRGLAVPASGSSNPRTQLELCLSARGAQERWIAVSLSWLKEDHLQGVVHDITARKRAAEQAEELATTDPLTGYGNRLGFERELSAASGSGSDRAILLIDFDHFKQINDTYGHHVGDEALIEMAGRLHRLLDAGDYLARLGGDEFVMLLSSRTHRDALDAMLISLRKACETPVLTIENTHVYMGVSIGIAVLGRDAHDGSRALQLADKAMYAAKRAGRNTWRYYDDT